MANYRRNLNNSSKRESTNNRRRVRTQTVQKKVKAASAHKTKKNTVPESIYDRAYTSSASKNKIGSRKENERKKVKRNSSFIMEKAGIFIGIVVIMYLAVYTYRVMTTSSIDYAIVEIGSIDTPYNATGIVIRDEQMVNSPSSGNVEYEYSDNEKVKAGQVVCYVKNMEDMQSMEEELDKINEELFNIQNYRDELSIHYDDFKKYNNAIAVKVDKTAWKISSGDISELSKIKDSVNDLWSKRNAIILSDSSGSAQELAGMKKAKEAEISSRISPVTVNKGGVISYYADGMEEKYTTELAFSDNPLPEEEIKNTDEIKNQVSSFVETNAPIFKIVYDDEWYIAAYIESQYVSSWEEGDYHTIYITGNMETGKAEKAYISKIIIGEKISYVVFRMDKNIADYITDRYVTIKVNKPQDGYKILNTAITEQNLLEIPSNYISEDTVIVKNEKSVNTISVKVSNVDEDTNMSYVQIEYGTLNTGSILQGRSDGDPDFEIKDIKTEKGIFVTNSGITKFKKINLEDSVSNDTHTVLDLQSNNNISVYDRYAIDASTVNENEKTVKQKL